MSKVLKIFRNKLELGIIELNAPSIVLGRSPLCDQILRVPGIKPVQFLLEWVGEGEFNPNNGFWTIFDIGHVMEVDEEHTVEGVDVHKYAAHGLVINNELEFFDLTWKMSKDKIHSTQINSRILSRELSSNLTDDIDLKQKSFAIEIVELRHSDHKILDIVHFFDSRFKSRHFHDDLPFEINWKKRELVSLTFSQNPESVKDLKNKKYKVDNKMNVSISDAFMFYYHDSIYLVRFVNRVEYEPVKESLLKNKTFLLFSASFLLFVGLILSIDKSDFDNKMEKEKAPVRVVQILEPTPPKPIIENKVEVIPTPTPTPEPTPIASPEPTKEPELKEKVADKPKPLPEKVIDKPKKKKVVKSKVVSNEPVKPKVIEKVQDVNAVGLLARFNSEKKSTGAKKISSESLSAATTVVPKETKASDVVIQTNQKDIVNPNYIKKISKTTNSNILDQAEGSVSTARDLVANGTDHSPLVKTTKVVDGTTLGSELGIGSKTGKRNQVGQVGTGDNSDISGGLTKNQVMLVINNSRREIRTCYESALLIRSDLAGIIRFSFEINIAGSVTEVKVLNSEIDSSILQSCITQIIKQMKFPEAKNERTTTVVYPFVFKRSSN